MTKRDIEENRDHDTKKRTFSDEKALRYFRIHTNNENH